MSAMVSPSCIILKSSTAKSRGNARFTWPTLICMPVFSEAISATLSTAQFCTGGRYSSTVSTTNSTNGVSNMPNIHQNVFFILEL